MTWTEPTFDGGLGIVGYEVHISENGGAYNLYEEISDHRINSLVIDCNTRSYYSTRVYALSSCRFDKSPANFMSGTYCGLEPDTPATPSTSVTADKATLSWIAPFDGGYDIDYYTVYIVKSDSTTEVV